MFDFFKTIKSEVVAIKDRLLSLEKKVQTLFQLKDAETLASTSAPTATVQPESSVNPVTEPTNNGTTSDAKQE